MTNRADPDQLAFEKANWSGSTLFCKGRIYQDLAGQGLKITSEMGKILGLSNKSLGYWNSIYYFQIWGKNEMLNSRAEKHMINHSNR